MPLRTLGSIVAFGVLAMPVVAQIQKPVFN